MAETENVVVVRFTDPSKAYQALSVLKECDAEGRIGLESAVGVLVGWGSGALVGGAFDIDHAVTSDEAVTVLGRALPPGSTAVMASVSEPAVEVIDGEMEKLDGEVTRRPTFEVMAELEAADDAAEAAAREARRTLREERKAEVKAGFDDRVGKLKEKLHVS
jgi:uncharacterized membrane protein